MTERISLAEAYNNKDVVTQIAILKDKLDSIPDADLTNVVLKTGDQIIDGEKTFNDPIVANGGVVFANSGIHINGTLEVDGDIIQNGSAYETHAEQVFSKNDLIVTREDAIGGIAAGQLSGIRVKKYDGVSDLNLGVDSGGMMRVGDLGQEQPLATRDEAANMTSGALVKWDGVNNRMIAPASNVGNDTKPLKLVNGILTEVSGNLQEALTPSAVINASRDLGNTSTGTIKYTTYGKMVVGTFDLEISNTSTWTTVLIGSGLPPAILCDLVQFSVDDTISSKGWCSVTSSGHLNLVVRGSALNGKSIRGTFTYITSQ